MKFELDPKETETVLAYVDKYISERDGAKMERWRELLNIVQQSGAPETLFKGIINYLKKSSDIKDSQGSPFPPESTDGSAPRAEA